MVFAMFLEIQSAQFSTSPPVTGFEKIHDGSAIVYQG